MLAINHVAAAPHDLEVIEWHDSIGPSARDHINAMKAAKTGTDDS